MPIFEPKYSADSVMMLKNFLLSPLRSTIAISPKKGTRTAVKKKPLIAKAHMSPDTRPKLRGKTMLPEPKNIAKIAKPAKIIRRLIKLLSLKRIATKIKTRFFDAKKSKAYNQVNILMISRQKT